MIIAITGGSGFIGRRLVSRHLSRQDEVRVLTRRKTETRKLLRGVSCWEGDLTKKDTLRSFVNGVDILYHCAGEIRDEQKMYAVHVEGTKNLSEAAAGRIRHWVQLSSVGAYGFCQRDVITEGMPPNPSGNYEMTKAISDHIVTDKASKDAFSYSILRPSIVYGPDMPNQSLFQMIAMIKKGLFFSSVGLALPLIIFMWTMS